MLTLTVSPLSFRPSKPGHSIHLGTGLDKLRSSSSMISSTADWTQVPSLVMSRESHFLSIIMRIELILGVDDLDQLVHEQT